MTRDIAPIQQKTLAGRSQGVILLALALASSGCLGTKGEKGPKEEINYLVHHGDYLEAVQRANELRESDPENALFIELHRGASVAYRLEEGRRHTFEDNDEEALVKFEEALAMDPSCEMAASWRDKTREKLAMVWYHRARELHADSEGLGAAVEAYRYALEYRPDFDIARKSAVTALVQMNHREGLSDDYYNEGVRALHDYGLELARSRFDYSSKYRPGDDRPVRRATEVEALLSQERLAVAFNLEDAGLYAAARNEFQLALLMDPANEEAAVGRDRMKIEAEATRLMEKAGMMILRGEWNRARMILKQARELTQRQVDQIDDLLADIDDARIRTLYEQALDLEHDFRYAQAIVIYTEIMSEREFFDDTRARMSTLEEYVTLAADLYSRAAETTDLAKRRNLLSQIETFWPEYKDTRDILDSLGPEIEED
jgi:hypothetical protein